MVGTIRMTARNGSSNGSSDKTSAVKKPIPKGLVTKVQDQVLFERFEATRDDPDLITSNKWDQSDIFYETRRRLDQLGYDVRDLSKRRKSINTHIKEWCDYLEWTDKQGNKHIGIKRHEIGIFPADRAVM